MFSWSSVLFVGVAASCLVVLLALERLREKRVRALLFALGRPAIGTIAEYTEGEDGYLVTYRFIPEGSEVEVERTEPLPRRPARRPQVGAAVAITYLKGLPSISRAQFETLA